MFHDFDKRSCVRSACHKPRQTKGSPTAPTVVTRVQSASSVRIDAMRPSLTDAISTPRATGARPSGPKRHARQPVSRPLYRGPIRVNLIAAGFVDTPLSASLLGDRLDERRSELRATLPIGRVVGPADVAALAIHIMTNTALTGGTYDIDGRQRFVS
jgi:hypothetical protein